ncbi:DUF255 domain-containing protein [Humisphaera borealis]|uniref:DUF255 domain-containing protein n=1 Tax=Humisphaera borealis TaxID=2807512 RepID=A0A7M2WXJ8_9BACT|nr:DUF255 domain-containing protein [Humisphaera borealis]QOV90206.1 DUF255 domain-containing protein [Humisphaera borealis]
MTHTNRLAKETSPYLLQHQHNPVDWYPWGEEAFERARRENKPIFLSVGYSTCYWCHVMERQCFEVEPIAALMSRLFVCIKVDREERPDVDQLYMSAIQIISRQGGWPMSVWLTPDRRPFYGGTYYPPTDMQGRPGFPRVCNAIDDAWRNRSGEVTESADQIASMLQRLARPSTPNETLRIEPAFIGSLVDRSVADYEPHFGGFGHAPKFPRQTALELLLTYLHSDLDEKETGGRTPKAKVRAMLLHTLDAMMHGGIRDHLGGGFHRYSTDAKWLVPHFEIMLYDNAMLLVCYAEAYRLTGDARYAQVSRDIADFVLREMTSPEGAFYTAFDAEVDHQEGLNYLWTPAEVEAVLGPDDARRFNRVYGLDRGPNFADPHHGSGVADKNILFVAEPNVPGATSALLDAELQAMRLKLREHRATRKQPLLDTKVLTSWNALMIRGLAVAGRVLEESRYTDAAAKAATHLLSYHATDDGGLYRTSRDGVKKYRAFLDDYAFLAWALTDLAVATQDPRWTTEAKRLVDVMTDRFGDEVTGGFYFTDRLADDLFIRQKTAQDSPLPSGNAAAAMALTALSMTFPSLTDAAQRTIAVFSQGVVEHGEAMGSMVQAALLSLLKDGPFAINAEVVDDTPPAPTTQSLVEAARDAVATTAAWTSAKELRVEMTIRDGWHVNAGVVPAGSGLIPTTLVVEPTALVAGIGYPPGEPFQPDPSLPEVRVYGGRTEIIVHWHDAPPDPAQVRVRLSYQPCNASACLPPVTAVLTPEGGRK